MVRWNCPYKFGHVPKDRSRKERVRDGAFSRGTGKRSHRTMEIITVGNAVFLYTCPVRSSWWQNTTNRLPRRRRLGLRSRVRVLRFFFFYFFFHSEAFKSHLQRTRITHITPRGAFCSSYDYYHRRYHYCTVNIIIVVITIDVYALPCFGDLFHRCTVSALPVHDKTAVVPRNRLETAYLCTLIMLSYIADALRWVAVIIFIFARDVKNEKNVFILFHFWTRFLAVAVIIIYATRCVCIYERDKGKIKNDKF
jgi:hypothetical protein